MPQEKKENHHLKASKRTPVDAAKMLSDILRISSGVDD
jgi:hypothetical protein